MKNLKKLMSVILTVAMLLSMAVSGVYAATFTDVDDSNKAYEAIEVLSALGVLAGREDGTFDAEADIKRSEFAAVICRAMNQEAAAAGSTGASKFADVASNHWALGYINWAADQGIVNGMGDGTFAPDANVTYQQAVTMIVRALGFDALAVKRGGYPTGYMVIASSYKITDGVAMTPATGNATRAGVAQLVYNAFDAPLMEEAFVLSAYDDAYKIYDGSKSVDGEKKTLLSEYHGIYKVRASVLDTYKSDPDNLLNTKTGDKYINLDVDSVYGFDYLDFLDGYYTEKGLENLLADDDADNAIDMKDVLANNAAYADYLGYNVNAFLMINEDDDIELVAMVPDTKNFDVITIENVRAQVDVASVVDGVEFEYWEDPENDNKTESLDFLSAANVTVYKNGVRVGTLDDEYADFVSLADADTSIASVTFIGSDDVFSKVFLTEYEYGIVESVDTELALIETDYAAYDLSEDNDDLLAYSIYKDGVAIDIADIQEGDLLNVAIGGEDEYILEIYVTNEILTASISTVSQDNAGNNVYDIDGTDYYAIGNTNFKPGASGDFYITIDGRIYDAEISRDFVGNYAYILDIAEDASGFGQAYQVKMLTKENTVETFTFASTLKVDIETEDGYETSLSYKADATSGYAQVDLYEEIKALVDANAAMEDAEDVAPELLVTYKANGDTITSIAFSSALDDSFNVADFAGTYNKAKNKLSGNYTTDATVIFDLKPTYVAAVEDDPDTDEDEAAAAYYYINEDKIQVYAINRLKDDQAYAGYVYAVDEDTDEIGAMVVYSGMGSVTAENSLAVVKSVSKGLNAAGDSAKVLNVWQGEGFVSYAESDKLDFNLSTLSTGDVVQVAVNAAGEVDDVALIYDLAANYQSGELVGEDDGDVYYAAGVVIDDNRGVSIEATDAAWDLGWGLVEGGTNVVFDVAKTNNINNAFSGKTTTSHIRDNINSAGNAFNSDAYILVVKCNDDDEIEDVVAYKYAAKGEAVEDYVAKVTIAE